MKKKVTADLKPFSCRISFKVECSKKEIEALVMHYQQLFNFYNISGKIVHKLLEDERPLYEYYSLSLFASKSEDSYHLSTVALRNVLQHDLEIIRQLHYIHDLEFQHLALQ